MARARGRDGCAPLTVAASAPAATPHRMASLKGRPVAHAAASVPLKASPQPVVSTALTLNA